MANPRAVVDFSEIDSHRTTYIGGTGLAYDRTLPYGTANVGKAVYISASKTVSITADATKEIVGAVDHVEPDGMVVVQDEGYIKFIGGAGTLGLGVVGAASGGTAAATIGAGFGKVVEVGSGYITVQK